MPMSCDSNLEISSNLTQWTVFFLHNFRRSKYPMQMTFMKCEQYNFYNNNMLQVTQF